MKTQTYYTTPNEWAANICDTENDLRINCVGAVDKSGFSTRSIRRDYYLMYVTKGSMKIQLGENNTQISDGDLLIISPQTKYSYYTEQKTHTNYLWLHFTGRKVCELLEKFELETNVILKCGYSASIVELWKRMCNEFVLNDRHFDNMTASILSEILTVFSRRVNSKSNKKHLLKSVHYIHENYTEKISISTLAELENLSESHYRSVFSKVFGESPVEYISARRIEAAAYMLENGDKSLDEIAFLVGYNDPYYFSKQFKKKMGVPPGKYRKSKQN